MEHAFIVTKIKRLALVERGFTFCVLVAISNVFLRREMIGGLTDFIDRNT